MATKDRRKLQHIHSSIADKQPTPQSLEVGEIAVNNAANKEFLSLKNSNDKVVRFSSDPTIIDWIENKEVMAYQGQVRGAEGPSGTEDDKHSYGITNDDLLQNKSNIVIKLNQVAAKKTIKYDVVNDAEDIYGNKVNPSTDGGKTDGAGFAIDMSRYAMIGANPSFSSVTVTNKTDLSGDTTINGDLTVTGNTTLGATSASSVSATTFYGKMSKKLIWSGGTFSADTVGYNGSEDKVITVPTKVQHLDEWDGSCLVLPGCVQASGFYQSSDINLKENIASADFSKQVDANNIAIEQFNYKSDDSKRTIYGVIAQDVEQLGLEELVYTNDEGFKSVDYTSLMLLKIAYLENENKRLNHKLDLLTERFNKIEDKE